MARILFTTPILEHPPAGGAQLRIENTIKALSRSHDLYLVSRAPVFRMGGVEAEAFYKRHVREMRYAPSAIHCAANRYIRKIRQQVDNFTHAELRQDVSLILQCVDEWKIDVVWLGFGNISFPLAKALKKARPSLKVVCDTDSVWSRFVLRELPYTKNPLRKMLLLKRGNAKIAEEREWVNLCDVTTGVSEVDCDYYRSLAVDARKVMQFSNVIDLATYAERPAMPEGFHQPCIYLAGKFGHANSPMDIAARWMLDEVWPIIRQLRPDIHFYIVGSGSELTLSHETNEHVTVTGKLPSVLPYLCHVDVALVPLHFESGTRFKILEAAACNIPIVSTVLGAEGLPVVHGEHILIADEPEAFAKAVVRLVEDKTEAAKIAEACRTLVRRQFSLDTLEKEARSILDFLGIS